MLPIEGYTIPLDAIDPQVRIKYMIQNGSVFIEENRPKTEGFTGNGQNASVET